MSVTGGKVDDQTASVVMSGQNSFSPAPTSTDGSGTALLTVEKAFSGVNYLEALLKGGTDSLISNMTTPEDIDAGGSLESADTDSIFNKFSIFKYSKFIKGGVYQPKAHFIGYAANRGNDPSGDAALTDSINDRIFNSYSTMIENAEKDKEAVESMGLSSEVLQAQITDNIATKRLYERSAQEYAIKNASAIANPTAGNIIKWASTQSMQSVTGFQPYSMTDFMFCKHYGKIPNNRLITLRRYPFPISDALREPGRKNPIPIAQAVTWFGEGTGNILSSIGVMNWGLRWKSLPPVDVQQITGNEVTVTDILKIFKDLPGYDKLAGSLEATYVGLTGNNAQLQQLTKIEEKMQEYAKALYTSEGPYWNRVFGPVNVINQSTRRDRGMQDGWDTPFTIDFHYSFRSFNGLSPRVVAADLIANFLNLTYNDAQFLGQLTRYFPRVGVKFSENVTETLGRVLTEWGTNFNGNLEAMWNQVKPLIESAQATAQQTIEDLMGADLATLDAGTANLLQAGVGSLLADAIPRFIAIRSALSDRPIGEWHLVVGNPMNPIMVMGDLAVQNVVLKFDEEMGPDDFPTGCTFKVKLRQGKPRDKAAIERIFNLGAAKLMYNKLRNPSSAEDTFGETNNKMWKELVAGEGDNTLTDQEKEELKTVLSTGSYQRYRSRIRRAYHYQGAPDANVQYSENVDGGSTGILDDSLLWLYYDRGQERT